jgi:SWI/SNF-related matrix-associated actin-dependent regulator 1 of chromatin subfamily A
MNSLWPHQQKAKDEAQEIPKQAFFWSPRLGKTQASIEVIKEWGDTRGIVICPLVVCPMWSKLLKEAGLPVQDGYSATVRALSEAIGSWGDQVLVINYDKVPALIERLMKWKPKFVVADESHWIKSPSAKRARAVRRLAWQASRVRLLTGTPSPNHYGELWGQLTCVDPDSWSKSYTAFARRHLVRDFVYPSKIVGYTDLQRINRLTTEGASIVRREDVFGNDAYQFITRTVELPKSVRAMYRKLAKQWLLDEPRVTAEHVFKRLIRLQQLTSGYLPVELVVGDSTTSTASLRPIHTAKVDAVMADLEEIVLSGEKAIIFHRFRWEGETYSALLQQTHPGAYHCKIDGSVRVADRATFVDEFNNCSGPAIAVIQIASGGIGIDLSTADHALFVSKDFSWDKYKQALERVYNRGEGGKPKARCITSYVVEGTIDTYIEGKLNNKESIHNSITNADLHSIAGFKE